jgi:hypothetical protein
MSLTPEKPTPGKPAIGIFCAVCERVRIVAEGQTLDGCGRPNCPFLATGSFGAYIFTS